MLSFTFAFPLSAMTTPAFAWLFAAMLAGFGTMGPAFAETRAVAGALDPVARQPAAAATITRSLFAGLALTESLAIYCLVISMLFILANPFLVHYRRSDDRSAAGSQVVGCGPPQTGGPNAAACCR